METMNRLPIAYTGEVPGGVTVFVMDFEGGTKRRVVPGASKPGAVFPNWSPDGRHIVYSWPAGEAINHRTCQKI